MGKFNGVYIDGDRLDGFHVVDTAWNEEGICKRCGKLFIKKKKNQVFCSKECMVAYKTKIKSMRKEYGKVFEDWLNDEIDYSYSPEKF